MPASLANRERISDVAFVNAIGIESSMREYAIAIRRALSIMCQCSPEHIHPSDNNRFLSAYMHSSLGNGWDSQLFYFALERALGRLVDLDPQDVPQFVAWRFLWWRGPEWPNVGEWVRAVSTNLLRRGMTLS